MILPLGPHGDLDPSLGASGISATYLIKLPRNHFMPDFPTHPSYIVRGVAPPFSEIGLWVDRVFV